MPKLDLKGFKMQNKKIAERLMVPNRLLSGGADAHDKNVDKYASQPLPMVPSLVMARKKALASNSKASFITAYLMGIDWKIRAKKYTSYGEDFLIGTWRDEFKPNGVSADSNREAWDSAMDWMSDFYIFIAACWATKEPRVLVKVNRTLGRRRVDGDKHWPGYEFLIRFRNWIDRHALNPYTNRSLLQLLTVNNKDAQVPSVNRGTLVMESINEHLTHCINGKTLYSKVSPYCTVLYDIAINLKEISELESDSFCHILM